MKLSALLDGIDARRLGAADPVVDRVTIDSRKASGSAFVACPGATPSSKDGHEFVDAAVANGAPVVVVTRADVAERVAKAHPLLGVVVVADARRTAAILAERAAGSPSSKLKLVGVTGTNGKTTTTWLLAQIAAACGKKAAVLGTLGVGPVDAYRTSAWRKLGHTTPEAEVISAELARLLADGYDVVAMEVSSHALATARVDGLTFAACGFTNLTRDHLDFHGSMEAYFTAKLRLFTELAPNAPAVIPALSPASTLGGAAPGAGGGLRDDDGAWAVRLAGRRPDALTWGPGGALSVDAVSYDASGARGSLARFVDGARTAHPFSTPLVGAHNVENLLVAAGLGLGIDLGYDDVARSLAAAHAPPGRLERVRHDGGPSVIVDYAHTPDALERALHVVRAVTAGKLTVVFGCGGDRDAGKRPIMGRIAAEIADAVVITDDNPRSEDGDAIAAAIEAGVRAASPSSRAPATSLAGSTSHMPATPGTAAPPTTAAKAGTPSRLRRVDAAQLEPGTYAVERARRMAIRAAVAAAHEGDAVVIAGKGHERDQTVGGRVLPFDDVTEAERALSGDSAPAFLDGDFVVATLRERGVVVRGAMPGVILGVGTDSRAVEAGSMFVALAGERFDAHTFVEGTLSSGAAAALVSHAWVNGAGSSFATRIETSAAAALVVVDDTLAALQDLARAHLATLPARRIGLTGSNGKTTTKELIAACLRAAYGAPYVLATEGNLNNHIGVPLTALRAEPEHRALIIEMGMNHAGEIALLADIVKPTVGLVTNIGTAHQGNFSDGVEGVARAKAELFTALPDDGVAVVNADDPRCIREAKRAARCPQISFGAASWADVKIVDVKDRERGGQDVMLSYRGVDVEVALPLEGRHNAQNAAGAVAVGVALGLDFATCARGLADVRAAHGRLERSVLRGDVWLLDDTYNANPDSMEAALNALVELAGTRRKLIVLGEMRELGTYAEAEHRHIGAGAGASGAHTIFACGALGKLYGEGARAVQGAPAFVWAGTNSALAALVVDAVHDGDVVLVKGSRGARMEVVVDALKDARRRNS